MTEQKGIFEQITHHKYTSDNCFLCDCKLTEENKTVEHVIPKWVLHQFNLWDEQITLLNGTFLPYRFLTIPCCFEYNNLHLSPFENKIRAAFEGGYEEFLKIDKETLFLWLGKIYFGIMYRELFLSADRADPDRGTITGPDYLGSFYSHFLFLQGIRKRHTFNNFFPASIYFYKTQKPKRIEEQWDLMDSQNTPFISVRMGEIGIISTLQDCEATKQYVDLFDHHIDIELHPLQFKEMTTRILYKRLLMNRTPKFIIKDNGEMAESWLIPLQGISDKPIFDDWDNDEYASILSHFTGVPLEICQPKKGKVWTWMMDINGNLNFIPVEN